MTDHTDTVTQSLSIQDPTPWFSLENGIRMAKYSHATLKMAIHSENVSLVNFVVVGTSLCMLTQTEMAVISPRDIILWDHRHICRL